MANTTNAKQRDEEAAGKIQETAVNVMDKARQAAGAVADKAKDVASAVGDKAESAVSAVGGGMQSLAGTIREKGPHGGVLGGAASGVAGALDSSGHYLQEQGLRGMAEDLTNLIRRNPIPAVLAGIGLGFLLARLTRR
jgi:hypothetical protein